jgi:hypothetical protein
VLVSSGVTQYDIKHRKNIILTALGLKQHKGRERGTLRKD